MNCTKSATPAAAAPGVSVGGMIPSTNSTRSSRSRPARSCEPVAPCTVPACTAATACATTGDKAAPTRAQALKRNSRLSTPTFAPFKTSSVKRNRNRHAVGPRRAPGVPIYAVGIELSGVHEIVLVAQVSHPGADFPPVARKVERGIGDGIRPLGRACIVEGVKILQRLIAPLDSPGHRHEVGQFPAVLEAC